MISKNTILLTILFFACPTALRGQVPNLESIRLNFTIRWEEEIDSLYNNPSGVIGFIFIDSCYSKSEINRFNTLCAYLDNLKFVRIDGVPCKGAGNILINSLMKLPMLNTIYDRGGDCFQSIYTNFSEHFRQNIINLETLCPDSINCHTWQEKIFELRNLSDLSLSFGRDVSISPKISTLIHLVGLKLYSRGNIKFPSNFAVINLKYIDMAHCTACKDFPDTLPESIERIDVHETKIKKLCSNIYDLKNITYIDVSNTLIKIFPKNFDFSNLKYFAADEVLFTPEEWAQIEKKVPTVLKYGGRPSKSIRPLRKRE